MTCFYFYILHERTFAIDYVPQYLTLVIVITGNITKIRTQFNLSYDCLLQPWVVRKLCINLVSNTADIRQQKSAGITQCRA
jgi:hypothetical protein